MKIFAIKKREIASQENAQLLLLAGVIISIAIIVLAAITATLSTNASIPVDKSSTLKYEYDNLRKEFGVALNDKLDGRLDYSVTTVDSLVVLYVNDLREEFSFFAESFNGYYFDAKFDRVNRVLGEVTGVIVDLSLNNGKEYISEKVYYDMG